MDSRRVYAMEMLQVDHDASGDAVVVCVKGEVDSATVGDFASHLATALKQAATHPARLVIVDLQGVTFFGSAGLNALLDCYQRAPSVGASVRLVASNIEVVRPIEVTNLDRILKLYATFDDALRDRDPDDRP
jgi:anti-anti-sigma factor